MTYKELSEIKTNSMEVNLILDDIVNNARFCCYKNAFGRTEVSDYDLSQITKACVRYGAHVPDVLWV